MATLLSIQKVAARLGVNLWILEAAVQSGRLNSVRDGARVRTTRAWVSDWLAGEAR